MILLVAVLAGLPAGFAFARLQNRPWTLPNLRVPWLVILAFLPQFYSFYLPATRIWVPEKIAAAGLVASLIMLLVFCGFNVRFPGVILLALGLLCNLLVIALNGGFMPIGPRVASRLVAPEILAALLNGDRFGVKDIFLLPAQTRLPWLSDIFLPPDGFPYQVAFSPGDLLVALGAFCLVAFPTANFCRKKNTKNIIKRINDVHI